MNVSKEVITEDVFFVNGLTIPLHFFFVRINKENLYFDVGLE